MRKPVIYRRAVLGALVGALGFSSLAFVRDEPLDAALREEVHRVPVEGQTIVVTTFRPAGEGPFPWIIYSHGTGSRSQNMAIGRNRNFNVIRPWVERGFAVLVAVRRGYGESGGVAASDAYGWRNNPDFLGAAQGATTDILATVEWARQFKDLDQARWLLVGQSAGGFASVYTAGKRPAGLLAVLNFAGGRGGRPDTHPGEPIFPERLASVYAEAGKTAIVPMLWNYATNDEFFNPSTAQMWFNAFQAAGGKGQLVIQPPLGRRGHGLLTRAEGQPVWIPAVAKFFVAEKLPLSFSP